MQEFWRQLQFLWNRRRWNEELEEEMAFHREMAGESRHFGNTLRLREQAYEAWGWVWLDRLMQDLQYGIRILLRAPGFTFLAIIVLAIGIGVNVTAFSLFNMLALQWLPVPQPERIVRLEPRTPDSYNSEISYPVFRFYADHAKTLASSLAVMGIPPVQVENDAELTKILLVSPNYFSELGTVPARGRLLSSSADGSKSSPPAVVLSFGLWQRRFGGDAGIAGKAIQLNGRPFTVAGIAPRTLATLGGQSPDLWVPLNQHAYLLNQSTTLEEWTSPSVRMWGKMAEGASIRTVSDEMRGLAEQLHQQHPEAVEEHAFVQVSPGGHLQVLQPQMFVAASIVGALSALILLVACANVGGLMLARAVSRQHEIGIRIAIGAGRWRIFRQLCTESLVLGTAGALVGLGFAFALLKTALVVLEAPAWLSPAPDSHVLVFTALLTIVSTACFGLTPALQIARQKQKKTIARQVLVAIQFAASAVLLCVAALLVHAVQHALQTDPGFAYQELSWIDPQLARHAYTPERSQGLLDQMEQRLRALPGFQAVARVQLAPLGHVVSSATTVVQGHKLTVYPNWVSPNYFRTAGIPLLMGRTFLANEAHVVVVSESLAKQQWPNRNPLGQSIGEGATRDTVIGVVADAHVNALSDDDAVEQYWPLKKDDLSGAILVVRSAQNSTAVAAAAKAIAHDVDGSIYAETQSVRVLYKEGTSKIAEVAATATLLGLTAALVAGIGLAGIVMLVVQQRSKETAIRLALGSPRCHVLWATARQFQWPLAIGCVLGCGCALVGSRVMRIGLYGVSNLDPFSYLAGLGALLMIAAASVMIPAWRSLRVNLASTLHES